MWNIQHGTELENVAVTFKDSAPTISIVQKPVSGQKIHFGGFNATLLEATTDDTEGGPDCCAVTWTSNVDGVIGSGKSLSFVFPSPGIRTVTATATDDFGNQSSDSVTVSTENTPPSVYIVKPSVNQTLWRGLPYTFNGWAWDSETFSDLPCSALTWTSSNIGDPFPAIGCTPQVTFLTAGGCTATLTAADPNGGSGKAMRAFTVANPPTGGPPIVSILKPTDNQFFDAEETVALAGRAGHRQPRRQPYVHVDPGFRGRARRCCTPAPDRAADRARSSGTRQTTSPLAAAAGCTPSCCR